MKRGYDRCDNITYFLHRKYPRHLLHQKKAIAIVKHIFKEE